MARDTALDEVENELRAEWNEHKDEYRDNTNYEGSEVVYEDDEIAIVADRGGHVLPNLLRDHETPTRAVRSQMSDIAHNKTDYDWSDATAIVFAKK